MREENHTGILLDTEYKTKRAKGMRAAIVICFTLLSLIVVLPIIWMLLSAFKDTQEFLKVPPTLFPEKIELGKIVEVWEYSGLGSAYLSTAFMVFGEVFFTLLICGMAGFVMSRLKPAGSAILLTIVLWSMMKPNNLSMVPLYINFVNAGLMNTYLPMWMMAGANAFYTILFKSFFDGISKSYLEAARIDGAGELRIFARIILPLSKPVFMSVAIFVVNAGWGEFLWPYLLINDSAKQPLGVIAYLLKADMSIDAYLMMLIFVIIPPILFFICFQKYIMHGVSMGGVKG